MVDDEFGGSGVGEAVRVPPLSVESCVCLRLKCPKNLSLLSFKLCMLTNNVFFRIKVSKIDIDLENMNNN